jgi:tRNA G26 N,N-dimethylase Trm1
LAFSQLSVLALDTYVEHELWNRAKKVKRVVKHQFKVLDALSASGLRCIRYEKEIHNKHKIHKFVSNDYSAAAVQMIARNIEHNGLADRIEITNKDATYDSSKLS